MSPESLSIVFSALKKRLKHRFFWATLWHDEKECVLGSKTSRLGDESTASMGAVIFTVSETFDASLGCLACFIMRV